MTPNLIATYIPCLWCGAVQVWYGKGGTPQVLSAGRMCKCRERHEAMVAAGRER